jgi:RimJ/RimL family protein N-acetyltransferase
MISIPADHVTSDILALFDLTKPTMPRAFNVLEGIHQGQLLVDDLAHPTKAVVRESIYGTLYFGGQINAALVDHAFEHFHPLGEVGIGFWPDDPMNDLIPPSPDYDGRTLYFTERSQWIGEGPISLPGGYRLAARDRRLLRQSFDYDSTLPAFGTEENILQHTLGVVVLHEGNVVCEAATGAPTHGLIEVGVTTADAHRRKGLARAACTKLIQECEARGYNTWWDCAAQNTASVRLAQRLGYCNGREYRFVWWTGGKA